MVSSLAALMGVGIYLEPSLGPGGFRLTQHGNCAVDLGRLEVSHGKCLVTASGTVDLDAPGL